MKTVVKILFVYLVLIGGGGILYAQNRTASISGVVLDANDKQPIAGATVLIDAGITAGAITDEKGAFTLTSLIPNKKYQIEYSFVGYVPKTIEVESTRGLRKLTEPIMLRSDALNITETVIQGDAPISKQMGDTTQYNAGAYKTNPDATAEDLVAKMPGFKLDGGTISIQGEAITRVYVDGKAYFKDDPMTALNSLSADAIESIQQYDEKSDQSKFTGFDDGNTTKTINIITKAKAKNNYFGDFLGGYGTDGRYNVKANANVFRGDHRFTVGFGLNNINQSSISGGGRFYGSRGSSGIQTSNGLKLNYTGEFKKDDSRYTNLGVNYTYRNTQNEIDKVLEQNYFSNPTLGYDSRLYTESQVNNSRQNRHSVRIDLESALGAKNKIFFRPWASINNSGNNQSVLSTNILDQMLTNTANTSTHNNGDGYNAGGSMTWLHRINVKRSFSLDVNASLGNSNSDSYLVGSTRFLRDAIMTDSLINQYSNIFSNNNSVGAKVTYTEMLSKSSGLTLNYNTSYNWSTSDKKTYLYDPSTGEYTDIELALTNEFNRDYLTNSGGLGYSYTKKDKLTFNIGADYQNASLENRLVFPTTKMYDYNFNSVLVNSRLDYTIAKGKRLNFHFRGRPQLPSISQLQDVVDNSNPLQISTGNPNLNQSYSSQFMLGYNASNTEKSTSLRVYAFGRNGINSIVKRTTFLQEDTYINDVFVQKGAQVSSYDNASGMWSVYSGVDYSFPLKAIKSNMNTGLRYNYVRTPSYYNDVKNFSSSNGVGLNLSVSSNISENIDFTVSSESDYSLGSSTTGVAANSTYFRERIGVKLNWIFLKSFVFNTDYTYNFNYYSSNAPENPNFNMLNLGVGKKFLKNQAELRVSAYDLLNQSKSYTHTVDNIFIQDSRTNVLQRYFMLTFSYKFNTMKGKQTASKSSASEYGGGGMMGPPPAGAGGRGRAM